MCIVKHCETVVWNTEEPWELGYIQEIAFNNIDYLEFPELNNPNWPDLNEYARLAELRDQERQLIDQRQELIDAIDHYQALIAAADIIDSEDEDADTIILSDVTSDYIPTSQSDDSDDEDFVFADSDMPSDSD